MFLKLAIAGALALASNQSSLPGGLTRADFGPDTFTDNPYVAQVFCESATGTAFKIADGRWISARHVSINGGCKVNGKPIHVAHAEPDGDFSIIDFGENEPGGLEVDCDGFKDGEWYHGVGHAWGYPRPSTKAVKHSAFYSLFGGALSILTGNRFVPGMSGGPVIDQRNRVVGVVNAFGLKDRISFSRQLKDTELCSQD